MGICSSRWFLYCNRLSLNTLLVTRLFVLNWIITIITSIRRFLFLILCLRFGVGAFIIIDVLFLIIKSNLLILFDWLNATFIWIGCLLVRNFIIRLFIGFGRSLSSPNIIFLWLYLFINFLEPFNASVYFDIGILRRHFHLHI